MPSNMTTLNTKVPHWAKLLEAQCGAEAVKDAARLSNLKADTVYDLKAKIDAYSEALFLDSCADLTGNPLFAVDAALKGSFTSQLAAFIFKYSRTLRDGLIASTNFMPLVDSPYKLSLEETTDCASIRFTCSDDFLNTQTQHREFFVVLGLTLLRQATGIDVTPKEICFQHQRGDMSQQVSQKLGCPVAFECESTSINLDRSALDLPMVDANESLLDVLLKHGNALLAQRAKHSSELVAQVEKILVKSLPQRWLNADEVASIMGLSRRTFSRRLTDQGETFRSVSDSIRKDLSTKYLMDQKFSLAEIAYLLAFADQAGFSNAFRRWTGSTPGAYRLKHLDAAQLLRDANA